MKRLGHTFAVLAFAFALLTGAAVGAMAHVDAYGGAMDHHVPAPSAPSQHDHHKAVLAVAAACCPAAEALAKHVITLLVTTVETSWHSRPDCAPNARDITPDTPPPKTSL